VAARQKPLEPHSVETTQEIDGRLLVKEFEQPLLSEWMPDRVGYPPYLMDGIGPSPINNRDCKVTLDRRPALGPPGTVLLHILVGTTVGRNDFYYWIAPDKDYLVLRYELHFSGKDHVEWNNLTCIIDKVEQSPQCRWYTSVVRIGRIRKHGDDLLNVPRPFDPRPIQDRDPMEIGPVSTMLLRHNVTFTEQ